MAPALPIVCVWVFCKHTTCTAVCSQWHSISSAQRRAINPYVANSFAGWAVPHRLPIQSAPAAPANAGTSSFGMSGVNAHAIINPQPAEAAAAAGAELAPATWQRSLRCFVEVLVPLHPLLGAAVKVSWPPVHPQPAQPQRSTHGTILATHSKVLTSSPCVPPEPPMQSKQQLQFRLPLDHPALSFLWDHQVQAAPIMPGTAYFEMAAAAGRTLLRLAEPAVALTGATIAAPLRLPSAAEAGAVTVTADVSLQSGSISIRSAAGQGGKAAGSKAGPETLHLQGSLAALVAGAAISSPAAAHTVSLDAARAACQQPQDTAAVYSGLHAAGLQYGPAFRQLRSVQRGDSSAAARLGSGATRTDADVSGFLLHPALLDNGLQLGALVPEAAGDGATAAAAEGGAFVPAALAVYLIQRPVQQGSGVHAHVRRSPETAHKSAGSTFRDHALLSGSGAVLAVLDGLEAKQLGGSASAAAKAAAAAKQQAAELLYNVAWQASTLATEASAALASATVQKLPAGRAVPLAPASSSLLVLQNAMQQQAGAVQLRTVADAAPGSIAAAAPGQAASSGNALWGMLRAFAQEAPAVSHGGLRMDPVAAGTSSRRSQLVVAQSSEAAKEADGYGSLVQAGAAMHAVLLPSAAAQPTPGPYHLMPRPRGAFRWAGHFVILPPLGLAVCASISAAFLHVIEIAIVHQTCRNLAPEPVPVGSAQPGWVEVEVKAVGINFR